MLVKAPSLLFFFVPRLGICLVYVWYYQRYPVFIPDSADQFLSGSIKTGNKYGKYGKYGKIPTLYFFTLYIIYSLFPPVFP